MLPTWSPDADVLARPGWFVIRVKLPGVPLEAIHVDASDEALIIWGEDHPDVSAPFSRPIPLPAGAWPIKARATLGGGVLDIRVPVCPHNETMARLRTRRALRITSPIVRGTRL